MVTQECLEASLEVLCSVIDAFETGLFPQVQVIGAPQLGKRELYPNVSNAGSFWGVSTRLNVIAYSDGKHSLFDMATKFGVPLRQIVDEAKILVGHELLR